MKEKKDVTPFRYALNIVGGELLFGAIFYFILLFVFSYISLIIKNTILLNILSIIVGVFITLFIFKLAVNDSIKRYNLKKEDISKVIYKLIIIHILLIIVLIILNINSVNDSINKLDTFIEKYSLSETNINQYISKNLNYSTYKEYTNSLYIDAILSSLRSIIIYIPGIIYTKKKLLDTYK